MGNQHSNSGNSGPGRGNQPRAFHSRGASSSRHHNSSNQPSANNNISNSNSSSNNINSSEPNDQCQPSGLYESRPWEEKAVKKLIASGHVAPLSKGEDYSHEMATHECPICFLYYSQINTTSCCHANICTECYLQIRPQTATTSSSSNHHPHHSRRHKRSPPIPCPFCNNVESHKAAFQIQVLKVTSQELWKEQQEQQQQQQWLAHEQRIKADRKQQPHAMEEPTHVLETSSSSSLSSSSNHQNTTTTTTTTNTTTFGSYLEQDERVAMFRKRSESVASSNGGGGGPNNNQSNSTISTPKQQEVQIIQALAMTPQERKQLEDEMKHQQLHPLALQLEMEAHQRRSTNEQRHHHQQHLSSASRRLHQPRDWNSILSDFFDAQSHDYGRPTTTATAPTSTVTASDDNHEGHPSRVGVGESLNDLGALEAAILLSMQRGPPALQQLQQQQRLVVSDSTGSNGRGGGSTNNSSDNSEEVATQHLMGGSPLLGNRSCWTARRLIGLGGGSGPTASTGPAMDRSSYRDQPTAVTPSETVMDTFALLMRGMSEEEQLAMAIAASLQEQSTTNNQHDNEHDEASDDIVVADEDGNPNSINNVHEVEDIDDDIVDDKAAHDEATVGNGIQGGEESLAVGVQDIIAGREE